MKTLPQRGHMLRDLSAANFLEGGHLKKSGYENCSAPKEFFCPNILQTGARGVQLVFQQDITAQNVLFQMAERTVKGLRVRGCVCPQAPVFLVCGRLQPHLLYSTLRDGHCTDVL